MAALRTPRRRVPDTITDPVIFLPAPKGDTALPLPRGDKNKQVNVVPTNHALRGRRRKATQAAFKARVNLATVAGKTLPPAPEFKEPIKINFNVWLEYVRKQVVAQRRLFGHATLLLLALVMAAGNGFPMNTIATPDPEAAVAKKRAYTGPIDPVRMAIPMSATQTYASLAQERDLPEYIEEAPPLIKPVIEQGPAYVGFHMVQTDETLASIAEQYGITPDSLIATNEIDDILVIGEKLRIPRRSGVPHVVQEGDTIASIAQRYGVAPETVMAYPPNLLNQGQSLVAGKEIFVPNAALAGFNTTSARGVEELASLKASAAAIVRDDRTNMRKGPGTNYDKLVKLNSGAKLELLARHGDWAKVRMDDGAVAWVSHEVVIIPPDVWNNLSETDDIPAPPPPPPVWVWPTWGDLSSGFGWRNFSVGTFHNGIDIANRQGTPIVAARSGTVIQAGWCSGYGYCVKLRHSGGIVTEYGHMMSYPVVGTGQTVDAGDLIGYMGSTYDRAGGGYSTGNHLHFTVKVDGVAVNPLRYLP